MTKIEALSQSDIERIDAGTKIKLGYPFSPNRVFEVVNIHARGTSIKGKAFVCGYVKFGETSRMSFSASEGTEDVVIVDHNGN